MSHPEPEQQPATAAPATKPRTARTPRPSFWGTPWRRGEWLTPLIGATAVYGTGLVVNLADAPAGVVGGVAGAAALGTSLAAATWTGQDGVRLTGPAKAFFSACATTAAAWLWNATGGDPFSWDAAGLLYGPAVLAAPLWRWARTQQISYQHYQEQRILARVQDEEGRAWEILFGQLGLKGLRFVRAERTRAGFAVYTKATSATFSLQKLTEAFAVYESHTELREGAVRVEKTPHHSGKGYAAGEYVIHVDENDILAQKLPLPDEHHALSINDAFNLGAFIDGKPVMVKLREVCALIIGLRGAGKTNLLNVMLSYLTRCTDAIVWMIDVAKLGRTANPWNAAWMQGKADRPLIDRVATTKGQADELLQDAEALMTYRAGGGYGTTKITPGMADENGQQINALIIMVEEAASTMGAATGGRRGTANQVTNGDIATRVTNITSVSRSECIDFVIASISGRVDTMGGGILKGQCDLRIGMGVSSDVEAQRIFEGNVSASRHLAHLVHEGSFMVQRKRNQPQVAKSFFMGDDAEAAQRIWRCSVMHAGFRPEFTTGEQAAMKHYARRWASVTPASAPAQAAYHAPADVVAAIHEAGALLERAERGPAGGDWRAALPPSSVVRPVGGGRPPAATPPATGDGRYRPKTDDEILAELTGRPAPRPPRTPRTPPTSAADFDAAVAKMMDELAGIAPGLTGPDAVRTTPTPAPAAPLTPAPAPVAPVAGPETGGDRDGARVMLDALAAAGPAGLRFGALRSEIYRAGVTPDRATVHRWLDRHARTDANPAGLVIKPPPGTRGEPYRYAR